MLDCVCAGYFLILGLAAYSNSTAADIAQAVHLVEALGMPKCASCGVQVLSRLLAVAVNAGAPVAVILGNAAKTKKWLQLVWMIAPSVWAALMLWYPSFLAPPVPLLNAWASISWSGHLLSALAVAVRSCFSQVPLAVHCSAVVLEMVAHVVGKHRLGVSSPQWLLVRSVEYLGASLPIAVLLQQQGRSRFCASRGIRVVAHQ
eukprot:gene10123-10281_t